MNRFVFLFLIAATAASAQTTPAPKPATAGAAKPAVHHAAATTSLAVKLPPGVPPVKGLMHTGFALRYQEIKLGTGAIAEPNKLYKVAYTGWLAADGKKFDSSFDHPTKEPIQFPQGRGRVIPGWDQGFEGMKIGGKRRLFIPYQLAYGAMGRAPVIPAKADLIFDIELVDISEMPSGPGGPGMPPGRPRPGMGAGTTPGSSPGSTSGTPGGTPGGAPAQTPAPAPGTPISPQAPQGTPVSPKPVDPTAPTVSPNSAPATPPASTPPATPPPAAAPDKPAAPAQPNPTK